MTTLTPDQFLLGVKNWATTNIERIKHMWPLKGGWEAWTQAEICAYFIMGDSPIDILREVKVYGDKALSADLVLNSVAAANQTIIVELKCQSFGNFADFSNGLSVDVEKMQRTKMSANYKNSTRIVLGIYFTKEKQKNEILDKFTVVYEGTEIGICDYRVSP